jgi:hypothetical protein
MLKHTAEELDLKLDLIDENKNLLPYPYDMSLPAGLEDVGDGSILTTTTSTTGSTILLKTFSLPAGTYTTSIEVADIIHGSAIVNPGFALEIVGATITAEQFTLQAETTISVSLVVPRGVTSGIVVKPQIEAGSVKTNWVPNMDKIGTYVDRRFNSTNTKIKVLDNSVNELEAKIDNIDLTNIDLTETSVILEKDLYTYTNIGKITGASNTSPKLVAEAGKSLKDVFNKVFGEANDDDPNISNNSNLSASGGDSYSGAEYGTTISERTVTATFTLTRTGTAQYGYQCGSTKYTDNNKTFYYPIKSQNEAQIKLTLPKTISKVEDITQNSTEYKKITHPADTDSTVVTVLIPKSLYKSYSGSVVYCDLDDDSISLSINLPEKFSTTSSQTRYGAISASVRLGDPQDAEGNKITKFLTYFEQQGKEAATTAQTPSAPGEKTDSTSAYTITAGSYYSYSKLTSSETAPTSGATKQSSADCDNTYTYTSGQYLWLLSRSSGKKIQTYVAGSWADVTTAGGTSITLTLASGGTATYYAYRTDKFTASGSARYRLA